MAYIGKQPTVGNFVVLDAITTSATTTFALTKNSVAYYPSSANHCIVSLNGIIQAPISSFTISGSNIVFSSALTSTDVIDFIQVLGDVLNIGTPSDNTVSLAKLTATGTKDATTFLRGDNTFAVPSSDYVLLATTDASSSASVSFDGYFSSTYKNYELILSDILPATNNTTFTMRFRKSNADITTSNYRANPHQIWITSASSNSSVRKTWDSSSIELMTNSQYNVATQSGNGRITLYNPLGTTSHKKGFYVYNCVGSDAGTDGFFHIQGSFELVDNANALSGISFYFSSGNIASGNFKLYGIK